MDVGLHGNIISILTPALLQPLYTRLSHLKEALALRVIVLFPGFRPPLSHPFDSYQIRSLYSYTHRLITTINSGRLCINASTPHDVRINFAMNRVPNGELKPVPNGIQWLLSRIATYGRGDRPHVSYIELTGHLLVFLPSSNLYVPKLQLLHLTKAFIIFWNLKLLLRISVWHDQQSFWFFQTNLCFFLFKFFIQCYR